MLFILNLPIKRTTGSSFAAAALLATLCIHPKVSAQSVAQPAMTTAPVSAADELVTLLIVPTGQTHADTSAASVAAILKSREVTFSASNVALVTEVFRAEILDIYADTHVRQALSAIFKKEYTPAELQELLVFYKTPLGQKLLLKSPIISQLSGQHLGNVVRLSYANICKIIAGKLSVADPLAAIPSALNCPPPQLAAPADVPKVGISVERVPEVKPAAPAPTPK